MRRELANLPSVIAVFLALACSACAERPEQDLTADRAAMIEQLKAHGIRDIRVLRAMEVVKRHRYIPEEYRTRCDPYGDHPCPIGHGQTISQPYIVAYMTETMDPRPGEKFLEIGTGSGYQAAVLAEMGAKVYSIEIVEALANHAIKVLKEEGYDSVEVLTGDGYKGWPEHAPFDSIIVTCAPEQIPKALFDQLSREGRMILPVGENIQQLMILRRSGGEVTVAKDMPVIFVPMVHGE